MAKPLIAPDLFDLCPEDVDRARALVAEAGDRSFAIALCALMMAGAGAGWPIAEQGNLFGPKFAAWVDQNHSALSSPREMKRAA